MAIGHEPSTALSAPARDGRERLSAATERNDGDSIPGVFAAGDVQDHRYRQANSRIKQRLHGGHRCRALP
jgi:thioredoxin reductase (NADPH)